MGLRRRRSSLCLHSPSIKQPDAGAGHLHPVSTVLSAIDAGCKVIYLTDAVAGLSEASRTETEKIVSYFAPLHTELMTTEEYLTHSKPLL